MLKPRQSESDDQRSPFVVLKLKESEMSELQKPKSKREEEEEEANNNVGCREEQEQALVALVEHRSAEIDRLKHHISNYQTKVLPIS